MQTRVFLAVALACALAIPVTAQIVVTPASPYFEDFELGGAGWSTAGTLWELGTPAQAAISAAVVRSRRLSTLPRIRQLAIT